MEPSDRVSTGTSSSATGNQTMTVPHTVTVNQSIIPRRHRMYGTAIAGVARIASPKTSITIKLKENVNLFDNITYFPP